MRGDTPSVVGGVSTRCVGDTPSVGCALRWMRRGHTLRCAWTMPGDTHSVEGGVGRMRRGRGMNGEARGHAYVGGEWNAGKRGDTRMLEANAKLEAWGLHMLGAEAKGAL